MQRSSESESESESDDLEICRDHGAEAESVMAPNNAALCMCVCCALGDTISVRSRSSDAPFHSKMKLLSSFTHHCVVSNSYDFLMEPCFHIRVIKTGYCDIKLKMREKKLHC